MSILRKAIWPAALAAMALLFLGTVGTSVKPAQAASGDICSVKVYDHSGNSVSTVLKGDTYLVIVREEDLFSSIDYDIDNIDGNVDIVSVVRDNAGSMLHDYSQTATNTLLVVPAFDLNGYDNDLGGGVTGETDLKEDWNPPLSNAASSCGGSGNDGWSAVNITCTKVGDFQVTAFRSSSTSSRVSSTIKCFDLPATGTLVARPTKIEIVPALGSVDDSLITLTLKDSSANDAFTDGSGFGEEVTWTTDNCQIQLVGMNDDLDSIDSGEYATANDDVKAYQANPNPTNAAAFEADIDALDTTLATLIDGVSFKSITSNNSSSTDTISAVALNCSDASIAKPGPANVTAVFEGIDSDGNDSLIIVKTTVTVVGPPASITAAADVTSVTCGDRVTITVTVKDAIGQAVSDHTRIEAASNFGSVLAGTGAIAGFGGPVVPVASTLAETFNGVATFFLLTSNTQSGLYDVTVATGGAGSITDLLGGVFSTPVITAHVQASCTQPAVAAAAPTVTAPRTGTAGVISPPNTGDAGLAATNSGSSLTLFVIAGVAAFALAGFAGLKLARRS